MAASRGASRKTVCICLGLPAKALMHVAGLACLWLTRVPLTANPVPGRHCRMSKGLRAQKSVCLRLGPGLTSPVVRYQRAVGGSQLPGAALDVNCNTTIGAAHSTTRTNRSRQRRRPHPRSHSQGLVGVRSGCQFRADKSISLSSDPLPEQRPVYCLPQSPTQPQQHKQQRTQHRSQQHSKHHWQNCPQRRLSYAVFHSIFHNVVRTTVCKTFLAHSVITQNAILKSRVHSEVVSRQFLHLQTAMASAVWSAANDFSNPREHDTKAIGLGRHSRLLKLLGQHDQLSGPLTSVIDKPSEPQAIRNRDGGHDDSLDSNASESSHGRTRVLGETLVDQARDEGQKHSEPDPGCLGSWVRMLARGHGQALTWIYTVVAYAYVSSRVFSGSLIGLLVVSATARCADARAISQGHSARNGQGSADGVSRVSDDDISLSDRKLNLEHLAMKTRPLTVLPITCIAILSGLVALASFRGGREHRIRVMGYICVLTLVASAAPMVLHQAGGAEAEVSGPLWVFWTGAYLNFVLRGALLVRHGQAGYLSPLVYTGTVAMFLGFVFLAADAQSSRLYTTLITLLITVLHDVGSRTSFGGLRVQAIERTTERTRTREQV
jgi:hypothetical protein